MTRLAWGLFLASAREADEMTTDPILVIEGNDAMRERLRSTLELEGFAVEAAANGQEALDRLEAGLRPCVIVMDLMMPAMNGFEFRRQQLRNPELVRIPVITYSGFADVRAGARQAVAEPQQDVDGILALVRRHCGKAAPSTRH